MIPALERAGCVVTRSKGSHRRLVHSSDPRRATTVSLHEGKARPPGTLADIIEEAGFTVEEFNKLL